MSTHTGTVTGLGLDPAITAGGAAANAFLDTMRQVEDDPADRLAARIFEAPDKAQVAEVIRRLIQQRHFYTAAGEPSPELPPSVQQYIKDTSGLPPWADPAVVRTGEQLFHLYGLSSVIVLSCASLPECYLMREGVHALLSTQYLANDPERRVLETAHMIMDVMRPGGLMPKSGIGTGVQSAQKVRLMHATIRYKISHGQTPLRWNPAWGKPVNQEDLAYTLMTFSYVGVRSMETLGIKLTAEEREAYIHCWNIVGHAMGIQPGLLPANLSEAKLLFDTIKARQHGPNEDGRKLTAALIDGLLAPTFSKILPIGGRTLPPVLIRKLIGDESADVLGVPRPNVATNLGGRIAVSAWRRAARRRYLLYRFAPNRRLAQWFKERLLRKLGGNKSEFAIQLANAVWAYPEIAELAEESSAR
jgi:hypothetical protein